MELPRDFQTSIDNILYGLSDLLIRHIARVVILVDRKDAGVFRMRLVQNREVFGIGGYDNQILAACVGKVDVIVGAKEINIARRNNLMSSQQQDIP